MVSKIIHTLLDLLLPPSHESRLARLLSEEELAHLLNARTHPSFRWIVALFPYSNKKIRSLVRAIKYRAERAPLPLVGRIIAEEITETLADKQLMDGWKEILLIPVPNSKTRKRERGYNQTERISEAVLPYLGDAVRYEKHALKRNERPSQVHVPRPLRTKNTQNAFFIENQKLVEQKHIILIDDVVETGATLFDARRALLKAGASGVIAIAVAH